MALPLKGEGDRKASQGVESDSWGKGGDRLCIPHSLLRTLLVL